MQRPLAFPALLFLIALPLAGSPPALGGDGPKKIEADELRQMVFFAVLEGLYTDGIQTEAVEALVREEKGRHANFVPGCPLCSPALDALLTYRVRPPLRMFKTMRDTFGPGLSAAELEKVKREPFVELERLVTRWVARRLESQRLEEAEQRAWKMALERGRKEGMMNLPEDWPGEECPSCEGANGACPAR